MKTKFINILALFVFVVCSALPLACSNKDNDTSSENDGEVTEDFPVYSQEQINEWAANNIIYWLCETQTDTLTNQIVSHTPDYGVVLNSSTPTVRYTRAATFEDARKAFLAWITSDANRESKIDGEISVNMGSEGSVTFRPETGDGKVAIVDIQMTRLPEISQVIFVKQEAWPENSNVGITQGSTWIKDGKVYVCVKDCANGTGYLVHFITTYRRFLSHEVKYKKNFFHKTVTYRFCHDVYPSRPAEEYTRGGHYVVDAIRTYLYMLNLGQWMKNPKAEEVIRQIEKIQGVDKLYDCLYNKNVFFFHGDEGGYIDTNARQEDTYSHFIRMPYCRMTPGDVDSRKFRYNCFAPESVDDFIYEGNQSVSGPVPSLLLQVYGVDWTWNCSDCWNWLMELDVIPFDTGHTIQGLGLTKKEFN